MKRYVLGFLACIQSSFIFCEIDAQQKIFYKKFLKWEKQHITSSPLHKQFMKEFILEYKNYYDRVRKSNDIQEVDILNLQQAALQNIMDNWESFYKAHIPLKSFYDSAKSKYKDSNELKRYFQAYEAYDKNPKDLKLIAKVKDEQNKIQNLIKSSN